MGRQTGWVFFSIVAFVFTLVMNGAANIIPLGGRDTGEISDSFPVLFTPAGYVFAIWGIIYLGLLAFMVYQALPTQDNNRLLVAIRPWFIANCLLNGSWIALWHFGYVGGSMAVMLGILGTLIGIYQTMNKRSRSTADFLCVVVPFSIYLGWISVATIANASVLLYQLNWNGWGVSSIGWTIAMIAIATSLAFYMLEQERNTAFGLVVIWALVGIAQARTATDTPLIPLVASIAAVLLTVFVFVDLPARKKRLL